MKRLPLVASLAFVLTAGIAALAPGGGGNFDISRYTIDGGGGSSTGSGGFELTGTIGQHDAGTVITGGNFALLGGFLPGIGLPDGMPCPWDLNGDGTISTNDLLILFAFWGPCGDCNNCPADLNGDCIVNTSDLLELFANWGPCIL